MSETRDLLFELGTEELPPTSLLTLQNALKVQLEQALDKANLSHGAVRAYATPRRLAVSVADLVTAQPDKTVERRGPAITAAFQADGMPTKAATGFARSCNVSFEQLGRLKTDKGEWLSYHQTIQGTETASLIPDMLTSSLMALPIAKRMRWGDSSSEFVRPVHTIVLLFGEQVVETEVLGITADRYTFGHRFHQPEPIRLDHPNSYASQLLSGGKVMADFEQRRQTIEQQAVSIAQNVNGIAHIEADLLEEITALVEWPVAVLGRFDERFLQLPPEVLITTMQSHQKYFPVKNAEGDLLPYFITLSNIESKRPESVRQGNERVIGPRLSDAEFFWTQDQKRPLADRLHDLETIVFQKTLGTLAAKTRRVEHLAAQIAEQLTVDAASARRAATLAKADLLTDMVGEFPSLQGLMGRYYALANGEPAEVATALEEQYWPKQSGGALPETDTGLVLSLADKLDTLTGIFSAGLIPTGDKDPYALRRAALGILRMLIEKRLDLDLSQLVTQALAAYEHSFDHEKTRQQVLGFMSDRLKGYSLDRGYQADEFDAVLSVHPGKPLDFERRLQAVQVFRTLPEAGSLAAANKRIRNILRKAECEENWTIQPQQLIESAEQLLFTEHQSAIEAVKPAIEQRDYHTTLQRLAKLRDPVDRFFDEVMVMVEDSQLRQNRLALLSAIETLFLQVADIARLQIDKNSA